MPITIDNVAVFSLGGVAGFLIRTLIDHFLAKSRIREDREAKAFEEAATIFRTKVLSALEGIYPITRSWWDESLFPKFQQSVPIIETAVAEFRYFIKHKAELDAAIKNYRDYCQRRAYERGAPHMTYPNSPGIPKTETDPIAEFKIIIEHLLSFTDKK